MENQIKCTLKKHKEIYAIKYCPECRIYLCNKCDNYHSLLFDTHNSYNLNKNGDNIFTGFCQEKNHSNKLEYFCKTHNQLCCANCIGKINEKGDGQHKKCDIASVENIKEEKKNKLIENIKYLEELENIFNEKLKELKDIFIKIEKDKEELKLKIQKIFTKIRNTISEREDKLLLEIDNLYNDKFINEEIINKGEKLPKKIKTTLENGKLINKEWDKENLNKYINDCINIENNIKTINEYNQSINKYKNNEKIKINFEPQEESLNYFLETIKNFGNIYTNKFSFKDCPNNIRDTRKYKIVGEMKNKVIKTGPYGWMGTICENELDQSIEEHIWKIIIHKTKDKQIMFGVAPIDFDINLSEWNTCGWYYNCLYSSLRSGPPHNYNDKESGLSKIISNEIIIIMNIKKRSLKFIINNEDKGDSYTNIPLDKPIFPAVFLGNQDDCVEITEC